jgi:hypothetical protein
VYGSTARLGELPQREGVPPDEHALRGCVERGQSSEGKKVKRPKAQHPLLVSPFHLQEWPLSGSRGRTITEDKRSKLNARAIVLVFDGFTLLPFCLRQGAVAPHQFEGRSGAGRKASAMRCISDSDASRTGHHFGDGQSADVAVAAYWSNR